MNQLDEDLKAARRAEIWLVVLTIICIAVVGWFGMGCITLDDIRELIPEKPVIEKPAEPPPPPPANPPEQGNNRFLWKPVSESRQGKAAVLIPAKIKTTSITVNDERPAETRGKTNGNRDTYFLSRTGSAYGSNVSVVAFDGRNEVARWTIPNGAERWER